MAQELLMLLSKTLSGLTSLEPIQKVSFLNFKLWFQNSKVTCIIIIWEQMKAPLQSKMPFPSSKKWDQSQHYNGMSIFNTLANIMVLLALLNLGSWPSLGRRRWQWRRRRFEKRPGSYVNRVQWCNISQGKTPHSGIFKNVIWMNLREGVPRIVLFCPARDGDET